MNQLSNKLDTMKGLLRDDNVTILLPHIMERLTN